MEYRLRRPCPHCPFRTDVPPYLRKERAQEIATSIARGATFPCHETTENDDEDAGRVAVAGSQACAGAMIAMEKSAQPNQMMRVAGRLGMFDPTRLDLGAPVVGSLAAFVRHHQGLDADGSEPEPCSIVEMGCEAPAGFMEGGTAVPNTEIEEGMTEPCVGCGEPVCESCSEPREDGRICCNCAVYD